MQSAKTPWYRELNRYHWFVLTVAALGWLFDTMDQQLFTLARKPAMQELLAVDPPADETSEQATARKAKFAKDVAEYGGYATSIFLIGWASGGLAFGVLGDRIGRAKTMLLTILIYSLFTGLSAFSRGFWDFAFYRFLTGLGVGGEFAVGVALVAEVMPDTARPYALGLLQALSAVGNITAALINIGLGQLQESGVLGDLVIFGTKLTAWRLMFVVGTVPALLALVIRRRLKEPERWQAVAVEGVAAKQLGSYGQLFGDARWRKNAIVGLCLAFSGVVGLWGIGFFAPDLVRSVFTQHFQSQGLSPAEVEAKLFLWTGINSVMQNIGGFFGIYVFSIVTHWIGRRISFAISFVAALLSTAFFFWYVGRLSDMFWMTPLMGFCQLALFGGYAIYFPELFPTRLRSTGVSFCYNVGRFIAAVGPFMLAKLTSEVFTKAHGYEREPMRYAGVVMCCVFLLGLAVLPFAPETKGRPLPE
ncbi:MAG TPA: MFS transporter [Pirellulales bacterium]|jgi:MFS family permease